MSFPLSQNSFTYDNVVTFLNQELQLNAVPTLLEEHQEYLVYKKAVPLVTNISRYPIPDRSIGMTLRDVKFADQSGNYYDITRIAPDDKAFFQQSNGSNQTVGKFYLEGNEMVLTPQLISNPTGYLIQFFHLRPNYLVRNDRAATIKYFRKKVCIFDNSLISPGDKIEIMIGNQSPSPVAITLTATSGVPSSTEFLIGANANITASNIVAKVNALGITGLTAVVSDLINVDFKYSDISNTFYASNSVAFVIDNNNLEIEFNQLPLTYTNPDTDVTTTLYEPGVLVDFLQTNPGHRTYTYDVTLISIVGNVGKFAISELQNYMSNSNGGVLQFYPIKVGDYICLQNESIIPQIPPELHHALAERAASRVLMAIGDKEGYAISAAKIKEMDDKQATLIGSRVESSVPKVFNRYSLLRLGKSRFRRRY
jgi:hypothetical protein